MVRLMPARRADVCLPRSIHSGVLSIGLALLGAYGVILNVGDWGWLIGAGAGALVYRTLSIQPSRIFAISAGE